MKNITKRTGKLTIVERCPSSINGNPRYLVMLDGQTARTMLDSSLGYSITKYADRMVEAEIGTHYNTVSIQNVKPL